MPTSDAPTTTTRTFSVTSTNTCIKTDTKFTNCQKHNETLLKEESFLLHKEKAKHVTDNVSKKKSVSQNV